VDVHKSVWSVSFVKIGTVKSVLYLGAYLYWCPHLL